MGGSFGFIHERIEIKILILFILRRLPEPITFDTLTELTMCDDGFGYFDYAQCVAELVRTEHLQVKDNKYCLTAKGMRNGEATESSLPFSVRTKAENGAYAYRSKLCRNAMIKTTHTANPDGGYAVTLALSDGVGDIISMTLYTANEKQALAMERGFRKKAEKIYNELTKMMLDPRA